jgi:2-phosphoglycerate kinase
LLCYANSVAKIYLIGGTPRTGKTTLSMRFLEKRPIFATSADGIRFMLRDLLKSEDVPELFRFAKYVSNDPAMTHSVMSDHQKALDIQIAESRIVWHSIRSFIQNSLEDDHDLLIEGLAIMPDFIKDLNCDLRVVFLGNQSDDHVTTVTHFARNNPHDWMHNLDDETIISFAELNKTYSQFIQQEALQYKLPYIEIRDDTFDLDIKSALNILFK